MKKKLILLLVVCLIPTIAYAGASFKGPINSKADDAAKVKASGGRLWGVVMTASASNAACWIYDHASDAAGNCMVELKEPTAGKTVVFIMSRQIDAANGIYFDGSNCNAYVYYE